MFQPNRSQNKPKGKWGEDLAAAYLQKKGYTVIDRNFHSAFGEIDLVVRSRERLVFVEVKTRLGPEYGSPLEAVTPWKLRRFIKTVHYYQLKHPELDLSPRIDVIAIDNTASGEPIIEHIENVTL